MITEQKLSLKTLDERLTFLELHAAAALEREAYPQVVVQPEWLDDVLVGVISALRQLRQQGAYNLANELEAKYFPNGVVAVGDEITTPSSLHRSSMKG